MNLGRLIGVALVGIAVVAFALVGCTGTNITELVKAASKDEATASISVSSIYGTVRWCRTNIKNGNVTCSSDGISVKSENSAITVPVTVPPQTLSPQPMMTPTPTQ